MSLEIRGVDELTSDLQRMAEKAGSEAADMALKAGAKVILTEMKAQAQIDPRVRKGNLLKSLKLGSIVTAMREQRSKIGVKRIELGSYEKKHGQIAPHAHLVEYGHGGPYPAPPHPFIRPSFDKRVDEAYDEMRRVLKNELKF